MFNPILKAFRPITTSCEKASIHEEQEKAIPEKGLPSQRTPISTGPLQEVGRPSPIQLLCANAAVMQPQGNGTNILLP